MSVFFNSEYELRSGWKFAAFIVVLMPVLLATNFLMTAVFYVAFGQSDPLHDLALRVLINCISAAIATLFAARIIENASIQVIGVGFHKAWASHFGTGVGIAGGLIVLVMLGSWSLGELHVEWTASKAAPGQAALTLGILIVAAAFEELIFRGYLLQILMKGIGPWPAMIAMSSIFGLLHAQNPNSSALGVFNTIVAGMMLSLAYSKSRSLWFPYGLHLGWNVALGMVVGFPLSGLDVTSLWTTHLAGPTWLLGGEYGPEGGAFGTMVFLVGAFAVWKWPIQEVHYDNRLYKNSRAG